MAVSIIAHRGNIYGPTKRVLDIQELNRRIEICQDNNFGIELDFRDHLGKIICCHDPPEEGQYLHIEDILKLWEKSNQVIALNIKSSGLGKMLKLVIENNLRYAKYFCFDMAIPDQIQYERLDINIAPRLSDIELIVEAENKNLVKYIWIDKLTKEKSFEEIYETRLDEIAEKRICPVFVSPELHGADHLKCWSMLKSLESLQHIDWAICTDFSNNAREFFNT